MERLEHCLTDSGVNSGLQGFEFNVVVTELYDVNAVLNLLLINNEQYKLCFQHAHSLRYTDLWKRFQ